jgi:hypothetical protein
MRIVGWLEELDRTFSYARGRRFEWGRHDCCLFAARCVRAISGENKRILFPPYRKRAEAQLILEQLGGMRALITRALGEPKPTSFATIGDVVLIEMGNGEQPAVCMGLYSFAPGRRNLVHRATRDALAAWTV